MGASSVLGASSVRGVASASGASSAMGAASASGAVSAMGVASANGAASAICADSVLGAALKIIVLKMENTLLATELEEKSAKCIFLLMKPGKCLSALGASLVR